MSDLMEKEDDFCTIGLNPNTSSCCMKPSAEVFLLIHVYPNSYALIIMPLQYDSNRFKII